MPKKYSHGPISESDLRSMLETIEQFDRRCAWEEYTDTDVVWNILNAIAGTLRSALGAEDGQSEVSIMDLTEEERLLLDETCPSHDCRIWRDHRGYLHVRDDNHDDRELTASFEMVGTYRQVGAIGAMQPFRRTVVAAGVGSARSLLQDILMAEGFEHILVKSSKRLGARP